ncbi:hypothetical protein CHUAL_002479 [Chamberlinius hualienensis]
MATAWSNGGKLLRCSHLFTTACLLLITVELSRWMVNGQDSNVDVTEGKSALLECRFDPSLNGNNPAYYWIRTNKKDKDNVAIEGRVLDNNYQLDFNPSAGKYDLKIKSATYERDNGRFECKLKESGTGNDLHGSIVQLTVLMPPLKPEITPNNPTVTENEKVELVCASTGGSPPPEIVWMRKGDNRAATSVYKPGESRDFPSTATLTLVPRKEDDGSEWICEVWNRALPEGRKLQASVKLNVNYYPRFSLTPYNPLLMERGTSATVSCDVDAKPPPTYVRWTRAGRVLSNDRSLVVTTRGLEDGGSYFCESSNGLGDAKQMELVVDVLYGPIVKVDPQQEVEPGSSVTFRCNVTSNPPAATIEWIKEGDSLFRQIGNVLTLDHIKAEDSGRYMCRAENVIKRSGSEQPLKVTGNATTAILIKHKPGKAIIEPNEPVAAEGEAFTMTCRAEPPGWPEPTYKWWREGINTTLSLNQKYTISTARSSNDGTYYCKASNSLGESTVATVNLRVYEPPRLMTQLPPQATRRAGEMDFSINCSARGNPIPRVRWLKNGEGLESDGHYVISTQDNLDNNYHIVESILRFNGEERKPSNQLVSSDRGQYTCQFENEVKQVSATMLLRVEHPPVIIHPYNKVAADNYETAVLECRTSAYPEPQYEWSFNGIPLHPSDKYNINQTALKDDITAALLLIHNVQQKDFGDYTCKAENNINSITATVTLQKKGPPETPSQITVVDVGTDYATISWVEGFNGGFINTTFSVHGNKSGDYEERAWDCQQSNPCNITSLVPQTTYIISVQAHNFKGKSVLSKPIEFTTNINANDIPQPFSVEYHKEKGRLDVRVPSTNIELIGRVEVKLDGHWMPYSETFGVFNGKGSLQLSGSVDRIENVRVSLCLRNNPTRCGLTREADAPLVMASLSENEIIGIAVGCAVFALIVVLLAILIFYCYRRNGKGKNLKKDYEMENANSARPKVVSPPSFRDGVVNKGADNVMEPDEMTKNAIYTSNHMMNGHMNNVMGGGYGYLDNNGLNGNNRSSIDSQDSLWMKANSNQSGSDRQYSYDQPPPMAPMVPMGNSYIYMDDYHHMNEDMMNQRNRDIPVVNNDPYAAVNKQRKRAMDHNDSPYRDVSGLPDPYMGQEDENCKPPQISLSFDESLESGYSTPKSRSHRIIREIIV